MNQNGQSLIETVVALAIAVIILSAIVLLMVKSIDSSNFAKQENQATIYAQQGIEIVRQYAASGHNQLDQLAIQSSSGFENPTGTSTYLRTVTVDSDAVNCGTTAHVTIVVNWNDGKCSSATDMCHQVNTETCINDGHTYP
jgi:type II secretory pathway pseudopilin PulG